MAHIMKLAQPATPEPTLGRIVLVQASLHDARLVPAIITRLYGGGVVDLVAYDAGYAHGTDPRFAVDGPGEVPGQWRWPSRS